jgi:hypothetical protein
VKIGHDVLKTLEKQTWYNCTKKLLPAQYLLNETTKLFKMILNIVRIVEGRGKDATYAAQAGISRG